MTHIHKPVVLSLSGHDPSGGAGIQADIETMVSHQCHPASVITALTEQNSVNVKQLIPQKSEDIIAQAHTLLSDLPVKVIKIGLIGHIETAKAIHRILMDYSSLPVIFDPVLAAGGGGAAFSNQALIDTIIELILPRTTIITPNSLEARQLTQENDLQLAGKKLLKLGCEYALITGTHEQSSSVNNQLFNKDKCIETYTWDRLPHEYHGSGCTLASSIASMVAHGLEVETAMIEAQEYTWNSLNAAAPIGKGQYFPNRLFWMQENT